MESQLLTVITYLISYHLLDPFPSPFPPPFPTCASSVNYMHSNTYLRAALRIIQPKMSPKSFDTHFLCEKNRYFLKKWPISLGYIASLSLQFKTIFSLTELVISSSHKWPWYMVMPIRCREFTESADYSGRMFTAYQKDTPIQQESILVLLFNLMKRKSMKHIPQP